MFNLIDVIFIIIILVFAIIATAKGFVKEFFNKASWILGIILGCLFCKKLNPYINEFIENPTLSIIVSFLLIFIIVFLVIQIVKTVISRAFDAEIMNGLDKALGFFFGLVEGIAIVMLLIAVFNALPFIPSEKIFSNSFFFKLLGPLIITKTPALIGDFA